MKKRRTFRNPASGKRLGLLERLLFHIAGRSEDRAIKRRKKALSLYFDDRFYGVVQYGPFKGLKFSARSWWGGSDRAAMLFGFYEKEVLDTIVSKSRERTVFLDLGAADGYYAIGSVRAGLFEKAYCFEISERGRRSISDNSIANNVAARIEVLAEADCNFFRAVPENELEKCFILADVEGAEFSIFNEQTLTALKNSEILIEMHDFSADQKQFKELDKIASRIFDLRYIRTSARDMSKYPELFELSDSDRWLLCSENRPNLMTWLHLKPR